MKYYLMVNMLTMGVIKTSKYFCKSNWFCYGKYQEGTDKDLQTLDNHLNDLIAEGHHFVGNN